RFRPNAPFRPWLLRIVANEAKNRRLATSRRQRHLLPEDRIELIQDQHRDASPEYLAVTDETSAWLLAHLERLRDEDRIVIICRHVLLLSEAESAAVIGCARGTVKSRLHRAMGRLRASIAAEATITPASKGVAR
ncbi:MAG TPA: RNA polymerase sigma factor, partial [Thermomicrobiales bacterium]|nr:RNA polymerase sigma factor [Thermomicrobiales bacterium]